MMRSMSVAACPRALDLEIWQLAVARHAAIMTKDEDFVGIGASATTGVAIVWLRRGNLSNARLIPLVVARLPSIRQSLDRGAQLVEIR